MKNKSGWTNWVQLAKVLVGGLLVVVFLVGLVALLAKADLTHPRPSEAGDADGVTVVLGDWLRAYEVEGGVVVYRSDTGMVFLDGYTVVTKDGKTFVVKIK